MAVSCSAVSERALLLMDGRASHPTTPVLVDCQLDTEASVDRSRLMARVRYMVDDVDNAVEFYVSHLGFELEQQYGSAVAILVRGDLELIVAGPNASAARPMLDGATPGPGGG